MVSAHANGVEVDRLVLVRSEVAPRAILDLGGQIRSRRIDRRLLITPEVFVRKRTDAFPDAASCCGARVAECFRRRGELDGIGVGQQRDPQRRARQARPQHALTHICQRLLVNDGDSGSTEVALQCPPLQGFVATVLGRKDQ